VNEGEELPRLGEHVHDEWLVRTSFGPESSDTSRREANLRRMAGTWGDGRRGIHRSSHISEAGEVRPLTRRAPIVFGVAAAIILSGLSLAAFGTGSNHLGRTFPASSSCAVPKLSGTVVNVALTNMGGPRMGQGNGMMFGGGNGMMFGGVMRLRTDRTTVARGTVSLLATNVGSRSHELVILPLPDSQSVGTRSIGGDGKIDEAGSLGEASNTCGAGAGQEIVPGATSWVTVNLAPGRYELVCNLPGHYAAGMYSQLTVS
jgi:uncharacterized cupredoxin-like copper-binding protein